MDAVHREYDRFGPWAVEISEQDPTPSLFEPFVTRREVPLLSLKIPRHVERRDARPGMDLYDYLVSLYRDELVVLRRVDREVRSTTCRLDDVRLLRVTRCLLRGSLHLGLPDGPIDLPYNTVSDALMLRLVALIRERYAPRPVSLSSVPTLEVPDDGLSFYYRRFLEAEARRSTGMRLLAAQGTAPLASPAMGTARRLLVRLADKRLLESMHFSDGRELRIVTRGSAYAYRWEGVYGLETTYIPTGNVHSVEWRAAADLTTALVLGTGGAEGTFLFMAANPTIEPYAAYLSTLPGMRHAAAPLSRLVA